MKALYILNELKLQEINLGSTPFVELVYIEAIEELKALLALSKLEGFIISKVGTMIPEKLSQDLLEVCEMLTNEISNVDKF